MALFTRKYAVSMSLYWVITFTLIYAITPLFKNKSNYLGAIPDFIIEKISCYALVGIIAFVISNILVYLSLNKSKDKANMTCEESVASLNNLNVLEHNHVYLVFKLAMMLWMIAMLTTYGVSGISTMVNSGTSSFISEKSSGIIDQIFDKFKVLPFILILPLYITAKTKEQKKKTIITIIIMVFMSLLFFYARRYLVYPCIGIVVYHLIRSRSRLKIAVIGFFGISIIVIMMYLMGIIRVWGISEVGNVRDHLETSKNTVDLVLQNTDFSASYYFLSAQLVKGDVKASPLGYLKVLFVPISRNIWSEKPEYTSVTIISQLDPGAASRGFSAGSGYIGEALSVSGIVLLIIISLLWGTICALLDQKYFKRINNPNYKSLTYFELFYLCFFSEFISEVHRGDFGAASVNFTMQMILIVLLLKLTKKKQRMVSG
jgi:hypothetical protein